MLNKTLLALVVGSGLSLVAGVAQAGPCSDQIASVRAKLGQSASLGPATTGTLTGAAPGNLPAPAANGRAASAPSAEGTSAAPRMGGDAGAKEMNAASSQIATSSQDVRRQQQGLPTMAAAPNVPNPDDKMSEAKMLLQRATEMDARDDSGCKGVVDQAAKLSQG